MNKNCHRIVFNQARGQLMAVAETTNTQAKGSPGERRAVNPGVQSALGQVAHGLRWSVLAVALAWGLPSHAQIIADPSAPANQRPTILSDGAGRPLVNIQTPSAAGVSRNTYSQFDVQSNGAVLNNSRASNPWLATGEARVILNEVNSSNPSYLRGQIAVNGSTAQVVIANPSGLKVDGASFVNANRVTLTTGTPVMEGGGLKALRVERGAVDIYGAGLNVQGVPYTDILSRALTLSAQVNAGAGELSVSTGAQESNYSTGAATAVSAPTAAPALAIDASSLGSMYAGRITLLATEAGVGVRNAAALQASSQLILTADGQLSNTGSISAPVVSLGTVAGDIVQSGSMQASNAVLLSAGGQARLSGQGLAQSAGSAVVVSSQKGITLDGGTSLSSNASGGRISLSARETVQLASGSTVSGQAGVSIASDTQVQASGVQLSSSAGDVNVLAGEGLSLSNSRINASAIQLEIGKALADTNSPVSLSGNTMNASNSLTVLATGSLSSSGNSLNAGGHLHMGTGQGLNSSSDRLRGGSIEMIGRSVTASLIDAAASTGSLKISSSAGTVDLAGTFDQASKFSAGTDLAITALGGDARLTAVDATADHIRVNATGNTQLTSAVRSDGWGKYTREVVTNLSARKSLLVSTVGVDKNLSLGNSSLNAGSEDLNLVSAGNLDIGSARVRSSLGSVSLVSGGSFSGLSWYSRLEAGKNLNIDAGKGNLYLLPWNYYNLSAGQDLSLTARTGLLRVEGYGGSSETGASRVYLAARDLSLQGASVDLLGASLRASRNLSVTATDGSVNINALENTVNEGGYTNRYMQGTELNAGVHLTVLSAGSISAQGLKASAGGDLRMNAATDLQLTGTSNRQTTSDGFWTTNRRLVNPGTLSAGGAMSLSAGSDLLTDAIKASAGGAMTLNALGKVRLDASQNWVESTATRVDSGKWSTTVTHYLRESITTAPTELSAASVSVKAGNELSTYGTKINSSGNATLQAGGNASYYAVYNQETNRDDSSTSRSLFGIRYSSSSSSSSSIENKPLVTRVQTVAELVSNSGGDTLLQGTQVSAGGGASINAGVGEGARADARIILEGVRTTVQQSRTSKSDAVVWQSQSGSGSTTQTLALPSFAGGGTFSAPGGISVQIPEGDFKSQIRSLSAQPGMGYLNDLAARTDVNWQPVKLAHEQWNYSQSGLTPAGAALLALAVAAATGGAGASLLGTTTTTATTVGGVTTTTAITSFGSTTLAINGVATVAGAMANAAFTSLVAQASMTLINNKGDVSKTLRDLGSSNTVKNMVISAGVAGVVTYTDAWGRMLTDQGNTIVADWAKRSQAYMLNTAAKGVLSGASSSSDWWTVAGLGLAGEAYQYWVGRGPDARSGVDRTNPKFDPIEEGGLFRVPRIDVDGLIREGKNIGFNAQCASVIAICHGTPISNALNTVPGFNAFATLHDTWMNKFATQAIDSVGVNIGSMPPALLLTYGSLVDQYRYINNHRR